MDTPQDTMKPDEPAALRLPQELTIYAVGGLHPQWLDWLATATQPGRSHADVDAQDVDQVDAAGLQLLLSLQRSLADQGVQMRLHRPTQALTQGCHTLGLDEWLLPEGAPA